MAALLALAACGSGQMPPGTDAACEAPHVTSVSPDPVSAGETLTVEGAAFMDGCADAPAVQDGERVDAETASPQRSVQIVWVQDGERTVLGTADASEQGAISVAVTVPATARPGTARVEAGRADPVEVQVR